MYGSDAWRRFGEVDMKKTIIAFCVCAVLFASCNAVMERQFADVVLDFDGSSSAQDRSLDANGLPVFADSAMRIETNGDISGVFVKDFAAHDKKSVVLNLPIGDRVRIRVFVYSESGIWSGSTSFTVEDGPNAVSVKLRKTITGAQPITFSVTKSFDASGTPSARLDVYVGNKNICSKTEPDVSAPSLCRDERGRIFVAYYYHDGTHGALDLVRYDSEGNNATKMINGEQSGSVWHLASDLVTGKVYVLRYDQTLYEVGEDPLSPLPPFWNSYSISAFAEVHSIAAHGGQLFVLGKIGAAEKLYVYDIAAPFSLSGQTANDITAPPSGSTYTDMLVTDGAVHLLRKDSAEPVKSKVYSKGALIKYDYNKDTKKISGGTEFGASDRGEQNGIVLTPDTSFYGPIKFIGFNDDVLYIADDGVTFTYLNEMPRSIMANKNRIASFNMTGNSLSFTDTNATWGEEKKVWKEPDTKTVLWKRGFGGSDYYAVERADASLGPAADLESQYGNAYTDVFCFGQSGALYIVKDDDKVVRYEMSDDGAYDFTSGALSASLGTSRVEAIAVDESGSIERSGERYNALYYITNASGADKLKRVLWKVGYTLSSSSVPESGYDISLSSSGVWSTALVANKDGVFIARTETSGVHPDEDYILKVKKMAHNATALPPDTSDTVFGAGGKTNLGYENINALQIRDGVLYGISTKTKERGLDYFMSGKLLKIGETRNFGGTAHVLYNGASSNGDFVPYRFIALKPKKLVIASDGGYGQNGTAENKNRVLTFTLDGSGSTGASASFNPDSAINFSKELSYNSGSGQFVWE